MILEPVQEFLAAAELGTVGLDLFVSKMPDHVTSAVLLLEDLTGTPVNHELPGLRKGLFQVIVRKPDYQAGMQLAARIAAVLNFSQRQPLSGYQFRYIRPLHDPVAFPSSSGQNREFSVNYEACYEI